MRILMKKKAWEEGKEGRQRNKEEK